MLKHFARLDVKYKYAPILTDIEGWRHGIQIDLAS